MTSRDGDIELSVVMPCLNEADTLETCIGKAIKAMESAGISGEVIIADNGSTDGSIEIAERMGGRVILVPNRGYGNALQGGIEAARGRYCPDGRRRRFLRLPGDTSLRHQTAGRF